MARHHYCGSRAVTVSLLVARLMTQGAKLEVESVVRETSEKVLSEPGVSREKLALRAAALELMAEVGGLDHCSLFSRPRY